MLRWVALGLLLANVIFALFAARGESGGQSTVTAPVPAGERLTLLRERAVTAEGQDRLSAGAPLDTGIELAPVELPSPPTIPVCDLFGPLADSDAARRLRDRLLAAGGGAVAYRRSVPVRTDYWVHLGPYQTHREALELLRELHQRNIDSFIIAEGELTNSISLGYFTREASAEIARAERRAQGYDANVRGISRFKDEYWVAIESGSNGIEGISVPSGVERTKNFCDVIASAEKLE